MVQISIGYTGQLRCKAVHGPSATELFTDAPVDNQGRGESFSPTDLLATSLGTCMLTIMGITAEKHGWNIEGAEVLVTKHMLADPTRRVSKLEVSISVPGEFEQSQRDVLVAAAKTCPVEQSLSERIEVVLDVQWG